jgi:hypothetical protein
MWTSYCEEGDEKPTWKSANGMIENHGVTDDLLITLPPLLATQPNSSIAFDCFERGAIINNKGAASVGSIPISSVATIASSVNIAPH